MTSQRDRILESAARRKGIPYRLDPPSDGVTTLDYSLFVKLTLEEAGHSHARRQRLTLVPRAARLRAPSAAGQRRGEGLPCCVSRGEADGRMGSGRPQGLGQRALRWSRREAGR
jgi:hypothetical protein